MSSSFSDFEILFPDDYINIVNERLVLYNELSAIKDEEGLIQFQKNLEDLILKDVYQITGCSLEKSKRLDLFMGY